MSVVRSMTGFGEGLAEKAGLEVRVLMRSINHRHAEVYLRLPPELQRHEPAIRKHLGRASRRGKLEVSVRLVKDAAMADLPVINREQASLLLTAARELAAELGLDGGLEISALLRMPGVVQQESGTAELGELHLAPLYEALDQGLDSLEQSKGAEGEALARDLSERLDSLELRLGRLKELAADVSKLLLERLRQRLAELDPGVELDQERMMQEVIFHADRGDITEELVRLESHFQAFRQALAGGSPSGKRLEFLLQEIHREVNTTGSKVRMPELSAVVIEMKSELEKVREQVLNLE